MARGLCLSLTAKGGGWSFHSHFRNGPLRLRNLHRSPSWWVTYLELEPRQPGPGGVLSSRSLWLSVVHMPGNREIHNLSENQSYEKSVWQRTMAKGCLSSRRDGDQQVFFEESAIKRELNEIMCLLKGSPVTLPINVPFPFFSCIEITPDKLFLDPAWPLTVFGYPKR